MMVALYLASAVIIVLTTLLAAATSVRTGAHKAPLSRRIEQAGIRVALCVLTAVQRLV